MSRPRVLRVGTVDEDGTLRGWVFDGGGEHPAFELDDSHCNIPTCTCHLRIAGFTRDELLMLVAEGSPDEDPDA